MSAGPAEGHDILRFIARQTSQATATFWRLIGRVSVEVPAFFAVAMGEFPSIFCTKNVTAVQLSPHEG